MLKNLRNCRRRDHNILKEVTSQTSASHVNMDQKRTYKHVKLNLRMRIMLLLLPLMMTFNLENMLQARMYGMNA